MPKLEIIRLGNPSLRRRSRPVDLIELRTEDFQKFLDDLADTCHIGTGVGIAAPQVGVNKRVIVVHVDPANSRYPNKTAFPLTWVINPRVVSHSQQVIQDWEGDLSAGIRAMVPRWSACVVEGLDRHGQPITLNLTNSFHARVFQHEIDHLNGKMFLDRVTRKQTLTEIAEYEKYWKKP